VKILITGGMGYIGSHTAIALIEAGHEVVIFDNLSNSDSSFLQSLEKITNKKINFIEGDIRDTTLLSSTLSQHKIGVVMHFAGLKAVAESVQNPIHYYDNNVGGSLSLIRALKENAIKKIVFSSSATVYGKSQYLPYDEEHPTKPINPYGRSKLFIEEILRDLAASDSELSIAVLRYFNPVGAHDSALIGESPKGIPNNLMPYIVKVASGELQNLKIFGNDYQTRDGSGARDYIHVVDLAEGHLATLNFLENHKGWYVMNLGSGKSTTVFEILHAFEKTNHIKIPFEIFPRREGDVAISFTKTDKAFNELHWKTKRSIEFMCESAWKFKKAILSKSA
jgi:UDP-glucose 4-epimerase